MKMHKKISLLFLLLLLRRQEGRKEGPIEGKGTGEEKSARKDKVSTYDIK